MSDRANAAVDSLIDNLHDERLRVWSIVITFFGDAVVPRGGRVWLGVISSLMEQLRINPGTLGAAMSRLTAEGWLVREKDGRRSHYQLAPAGREAFDAAARRVYGLDSEGWSDKWSMRVVPGADAKAAAQYVEAGFGSLGPDVFVRPEELKPRPEADFPPSTIRLELRPEPTDVPALAERAYPLDGSDARHAQLLKRLDPLWSALREGSQPSPEKALAARILLIHGYRRNILRDPPLPPTALAAGTLRTEAKRRVGELYQRLLGGSEAWLTDQPGSGLSPPSADFFRRFGGLPGEREVPEE